MFNIRSIGGVFERSPGGVRGGILTFWNPGQIFVDPDVQTLFVSGIAKGYDFFNPDTSTGGLHSFDLGLGNYKFLSSAYLGNGTLRGHLETERLFSEYVIYVSGKARIYISRIEYDGNDFQQVLVGGGGFDSWAGSGLTIRQEYDRVFIKGTGRISSYSLNIDDYILQGLTESNFRLWDVEGNYLYFVYGSAGQIWKVSIVTGLVIAPSELLIDTGWGSEISAMAIDEEKDYIFWLERNDPNRGVWRATLSTGADRIKITNPIPEGFGRFDRQITIDKVNEQIYCINRIGGRGEIWRVSYDGKEIAQLTTYYV